MLIQLRQFEIAEAIKQYLADEGINLTGKDISVDFTAGRKESGITADVEILPSSLSTNLSVLYDKSANDKQEAVDTPAEDIADEPEIVEEESPKEPAVAKGSSLFH